MSTPFARTEILIGRDGLGRLQEKHVLMAGLGGVGSYAAEAIARAGVGRMTLLDHDVVAPSNLNRQLVALHSTVGQHKTRVMVERLRDINPYLQVTLLEDFLQPSAAHALVSAGDYHFIADCIDSIACKAALVAACLERKVPIVSAMGAGNRLDVTRVRVAPLAKTHVCPLARELRAQLRTLDVSLDYPVVYSDESPHPPLPHQPLDGDVPGRPRAVNGTISYMPALFGMMLAGVIIQRLLDEAD